MPTLIACCTFWHVKIVLGIVLHLILAISVVIGEWVNLTFVSAQPYFIECNILFIFLLTNVLIVSRF